MLALRANFLDCETTEVTYLSLEQILSIKKEVIDQHLSSLDIETDDSFVTKYHHDVDSWILGTFEEKNLVQIRLSGVYWFHLTRVPTFTNFEEGILPLGRSIEYIWNFLYSLVNTWVSPSEWQKFRERVETDRNNHDSYLYQLKTSNRDHVSIP